MTLVVIVDDGLGNPIAGILRLHIGRRPVGQQHSIGPHLERCGDDVIPNVARHVGNRLDGNIPQHEIQTADRLGILGGIRHPRLDGRADGVPDLDVRNCLPRSALVQIGRAHV